MLVVTSPSCNSALYYRKVARGIVWHMFQNSTMRGTPGAVRLTAAALGAAFSTLGRYPFRWKRPYNIDNLAFRPTD
jgi:hypothetical protein